MTVKFKGISYWAKSFQFTNDDEEDNIDEKKASTKKSYNPSLRVGNLSGMLKYVHVYEISDQQLKNNQ